MQKRLLGKTGESLSVVGFGAIVFVKEGPDFARETVATAIDAGVNYFDMGPAYGGGEAEERRRREADLLSSRIGTASSWPRKQPSARRTRHQPSLESRSSACAPTILISTSSTP